MSSGGLTGLARRATADVAASAPPGLVLDAAAVLGRVLQRLGAVRPAAADVAALFDGLAASRRDYAAIARAMAGFELRKTVLRALVHRRGIAVAGALLERDSLEALEPLRQPTRPFIVMTCHFGAPVAVAAAINRLGIPVFSIRHTEARVAVEGSALAATNSDERQQAAALWRAVHWLRDTGVVAVAVDGGDGRRTARVPCLGRGMVFGRGAFAMARLSGAAVLPLVGVWTPSGRIRMCAGDVMTFPGDLVAEEFETASAGAFAAWYERVALAYPEQMRVHALRAFLAAPLVAAPPR